MPQSAPSSHRVFGTHGAVVAGAGVVEAAGVVVISNLGSVVAGKNEVGVVVNIGGAGAGAPGNGLHVFMLQV